MVVESKPMQSLVKIVLVESDPKMVAALKRSFADRPEVEVVHGSMTQQVVDAWVSPTTASGEMASDLGAAVKGVLGESIERAVQRAIHARYEGLMPAGYATCVETARTQPRFLISTPSPTDVLEVALSAAAALQVVHMQNKLEARSIASVALPSFSAEGVSAEVCADLMWTAHDLFREAEIPNFETMSIALRELLRGVDPSSREGAFKKSFATPGAGDSQGSTVPDASAAAAQLKRKLAELTKDD